MAAVKSIEDFDFTGKRALVRVDYNVPLTGDHVEDDFRIRASLRTLQYVLEHGGSLVLMSHLGRPEGKGVEPEFKMDPVAKSLEALIGRPVKKLDDCIGPDVKAVCDALKPGEIVLLDNLRFHKAEKKGDDAFGKQLAELGDIFISDAFGTAHRSDASMTIPPKYLPAGAGYLMLAEIKYLGGIVDGPERPFLAILGGAKVSDKLPILESLAAKTDAICIGGAMAYTFLKARGVNIGKSRCENELVDTAKKILDDCAARGVEVVLPVDHVVAHAMDDIETETATEIPDDKAGFDIGPESMAAIADRIGKAKTILFNGPVGVFEKERFSMGTRAVCQLLADCTATTVVGGGDAAAAVAHFGVADRITHVSTGGGASLELLSGLKLPGIVALEAASARPS